MDKGLTFYLNGSGAARMVYYSYYAHDGRASGSTGIKVDQKKFQAGKLPRDQAAAIRRLQTLLDKYEADMRQSGAPTAKRQVDELIAEALHRKPKRKVPRSDAFLAMFGRYMDEVEAGAILFNGKRYSAAFVKMARVAEKWLLKSPLASVPMNQVKEDDLRQFAALLTTAGLAKNTVASYMDPIVSILNGSRRLGWHQGPMLDARAFRISREDLDHGVYLTAEEQQAIAAVHAIDNVELVEPKTRWRDVFLLGCQLGMRHSDLSLLTPVHRQNNLVNINTLKTGTPVWVPLSSVARELWERLDGVITLPHRTVFADFIKDLGRAADIKKQILFCRTEGGVKQERWISKYDLLGTHTMRRSFATNAYKAGVPVPSIMKVTGHRSVASFMKYIRLSDEEHASLLLQHDHFK